LGVGRGSRGGPGQTDNIGGGVKRHLTKFSNWVGVVQSEEGVRGLIAKGEHRSLDTFLKDAHNLEAYLHTEEAFSQAAKEPKVCQCIYI